MALSVILFVLLVVLVVLGMHFCKAVNNRHDGLRWVPAAGVPHT
jgi:hypothetical protein